jgi:uncharacterized protein (DUF1501 family)
MENPANPILSRRQLLRHGTACAGAMALAASSMTRFAQAVVPGDRIFINFHLRGGADGLNMIVPYADSRYYQHRGDLALLPPGNNPRSVVNLDGFYGINPAMGPLAGLFTAGEMKFFHAVAFADIAKGQLNHFTSEQQYFYGGDPQSQQNGYLNRLTAALNGQSGGAKAIGLLSANVIPDVLRGTAPVMGMRPAITPPTAAETMQRLAAALGSNHPFNQMLQQGAGQRADLSQTLSGHANLVNNPVLGNSYAYMPAMAELMGVMLRSQGADFQPNIFYTVMEGYDSHGSQIGHDSGHVRSLADAVMALRQSLRGNPAQGIEDLWQRTVLVITTEFGRSVTINGSQGTDHGNGGLLLVFSGDRNLLGNFAGPLRWPGLNVLAQNNSLPPVADAFDLLRSLLAMHYPGRLTQNQLQTILPQRQLDLLRVAV